MSNNKNFKVENGIQAASYYEKQGTVNDSAFSTYLQVTPTVENYTSITNPTYGIRFKPDGTKLFFQDSIDDAIKEYTLSTAWDLSTASLTHTLDVSSLAVGETGLEMKPDGTKMYVTDVTNDEIRQYALSTAWDLSTATSELTVSSPHNNPYNIQFKPDGTKVYLGTTTDIIEYPLSTAWDLSTIGSANYTFAMFRQTGYVWCINSDGTKIFWNYSYSTSLRYIYEYDLTTAWDLSSYSATSNFFDMRAVFGTSYYGITFKPDDTKLYVADYTLGIGVLDMEGAEKVCDLSTGSYFEIDYDGTVQISLTNPPESGKVGAALVKISGKPSFLDSGAGPRAAFTSRNVTYGRFGLTFNGDGTALYISNGSGPTKYNITTPWDLSTVDPGSLVSYAGLISGTGNAISFANDGYSLFTADNSVLYDHTLTTPYDLNTATLNQTVSSTFTQDYTNLAVKNNDTKIYTSQGSGGVINEYTLSTAGDPSTATLANTFSTGATNIWGIDLNSTGTKMYVTIYDSATTTNELWIYNLTTAWDVSTANFSDDIVISNTSGSYPYGTYNAVISPNEEYYYFTSYEVNTPLLFKVLQHGFSDGSLFQYNSNIEFNRGITPSRPPSEASRYQLFTTIDGGTTYKCKTIFEEVY